MRTFGILMSVCGALWLLIAFNFDTSVSTGAGRVENIGLIAQRQNHLYIAGLISLIGVLFWIFGDHKSPENMERGKISRSTMRPAPAPHSLDSDPYRIWLAEKYEIHRNETFQKYIYNQHTFETLDDALLAAHEHEAQLAIDDENSQQEFFDNSSQQDAELAKVLSVLMLVTIGILIFWLLIG